MKLLLPLLFTVVFFPGSHFAQSKNSKGNEPAELQTARSFYEQALSSSQSQLKDSVTARAKRYSVDLQTLEKQLTASGKLDALAPVKSERDAYEAGRGTFGFPDSEKSTPTAAKELRRAYDRDVAKIRAGIAATARPLAVDYMKQLATLESKFVRERSSEGVLAVRNEKMAIQQASNDPLFGGDAAILGSWLEPNGTKTDFHPDGSVKDGTGASGSWAWENRSQRTFVITWQNNRGKENYELLPDGFGMVGRSKQGDKKPLQRK